MKETQYELDFIGFEDKRQSDRMMYLKLCSDIQDEFKRFEGKHNIQMEVADEEESKNLNIAGTQLPKDLKEKQNPLFSMMNLRDSSRLTKHDSNTKQLLEGYFKVIQEFYEDNIFHKTYCVSLSDGFYNFEKGFRSMDESFENIWLILKHIFHNIDYKTFKNFKNNSEEIYKRIWRNTWAWFEKEFWSELELDKIWNQFIKQEDGSYEITDKVITAIVDRIVDHMKDINYERDNSKWELEDDYLPIYAIIYFWVRAGKRNEAIKIAQSSKIPIVKLICALLEDENLYIEGTEEMAGFPDNHKLYVTALTELSNISKRRNNEEDGDEYKKDIFKEALLILLTKSTLSSHPLLNTNLSDYLWSCLQKWCFDKFDTTIPGSNQDVLTLKMVQNIILSHGEAHFNETGAYPLNFYKVLMLVGLYKEAITYLDRIDKHRVENTHVAIYLNECGILSLNEQDEDDVSFEQSRSNQKKEKKNPLFVTIILNFIDFLGPDYFPESIIYSTLLEDNYLVETISDLFVKNNSFSILIETTDKSGLNLVTKKNLQLNDFLPQEIVRKVIKKVWK